MDTDRKLCPICKEQKPFSSFQLNPDGSIRKHVCKACYARKWRTRAKLDMLNAYGRKCACCGEAHPQFLTLDHVNNDGGEHRARFDSRSAELIYRDVKREGFPKDKYQLLCWNCNCAKEYWGTCPHQMGLTADVAYAEMEGKIFHTGKQYQNMNLEPLKLGPHAPRIIKRVVDPSETLAKLLGKFSPEDVMNLLKKIQGP